MVDRVEPSRVRPNGERSTAELVQQAGVQISRLVRDEFALARAELMQQGRQAGMGAGLLGGGGLLALYGIGALVLAAIAGLDAAMPAWLAALLVGIAILIIAGLLALAGRRRIRRAVPPAAAVTRSLRKDVAAVTTAVQDRVRP
jgi:hypothetical protein